MKAPLRESRVSWQKILSKMLSKETGNKLVEEAVREGTCRRPPQPQRDSQSAEHSVKP